ncbi:MAG: 1-acyl-sn-glycerol-3-phosphate acyltransferase [Proteobacteria bacterium]|nr:1-acyl-sn-glycerol-3-phosphate acyltransferase [Pseudomonadota bacterium]
MLKIIRAALIGLNLFVWGIVGSFLCLFRPFNSGNALIFARILSFFGRKILGMKVTVKNGDSLNNDSPCIYISNHQSMIDLFVCGKVISRRTVSIGKKSLKFLPFFGPLYWLSGNILIDRENPRKALTMMDQATKRALTEKNTSIWIFPEGTRNPTDTLLDFKRGAFRTAIKAKVPIVPICISSYAQNADFNRLQSTSVAVTILDPISTHDRGTRDSAVLANQCRKAMQETIDRMNAELR